MAVVISIEALKRCESPSRQKIRAKLDELCSELQLMFDFGYAKPPRRQRPLRFKKRATA